MQLLLRILGGFGLLKNSYEFRSRKTPAHSIFLFRKDKKRHV
jgi:hypothetical protein